MFNHKLWTDTKRTGLIYFTIGMLLCVWVAVWYFAFARSGEKPLTNDTWFWLVGFFMTGLTLMLIGAVQGIIHRSAQKAEVQLSAKSADAVAPGAAAMSPGMVPPAPIMVAPPVPAPGMPMQTVMPAIQPAAPVPTAPVRAGV